eukprot:TRINITY_DN13141_c0_g1_i1.p1 TRINITY_DN13141_c0_g1~~TRINITY_DN13141_c0_g1_i1.p1  ORF type:complete len:152 (+),score=14.51 TRINITY_DN13141_c0_g1_i1:125-580(+)
MAASLRRLLTSPSLVSNLTLKAPSRAYGSIPKVADVIVKITAIDPDGDRHEIKGLTGQSIFTTLVRNNLDDVARHSIDELPSCTGNCEVVLPNEWLAKLPPPSPEELAKLKSVSSKGTVNPHSRLGCQLKLSKDMAGMTVAMIQPRPWLTL